MMARRPKGTHAPAWQPDDVATAESYRLEGFEPDNLLAFMALLGLLRALETARPAWRPRTFWDVETHPWRPVLTLAERQTQAAVSRAAAEGARDLLSPMSELCRTAAAREQQRAASQVQEIETEIENVKEKGKSTTKLAEQLKKQRKRASQPRSEQKVTVIASTFEDLTSLHGAQDPERDAWIASLTAWARGKNGEREVRNAPFKLTSGQQAFAGLFVTLAESCDWLEIAQSLFQPWRYLHRGDSFRLDSAEARRYAYMAGDPTDKALWTVDGQTGNGVAPSEKGANTLAAIGFRSFPIISLQRDVAIPGMARKNKALLRIPIWTVKGGRGATRAGIESRLWQGGADNPPTDPNVVGWQRFRIFEISDSPTSKYKSIAYDGFIDRDEGAAAGPP